MVAKPADALVEIINKCLAKSASGYPRSLVQIGNCVTFMGRLHQIRGKLKKQEHENMELIIDFPVVRVSQFVRDIQARFAVGQSF